MGQEQNECSFQGYNVTSSSWSQLLNDELLAPTKDISWVDPNSLSDTDYTSSGYPGGSIKITDNGPPDIDSILRSFKFN